MKTTTKNEKNTTCNILIAGVGGQGTVLAARLLGFAAMQKGFDVRGSETIGMAQRGGSVVSHVRIGHDIASPLISPGGANLVIALEPGEGARASAYLKPGGVMIVSDRALVPAVCGDYAPVKVIEWLEDNSNDIHILSGEDILKNCGERGLNVALLGAAAALGVLPFAATELEVAIGQRLNSKFVPANMEALSYGMKCVEV